MKMTGIMVFFQDKRILTGVPDAGMGHASGERHSFRGRSPSRDDVVTQQLPVRLLTRRRQGLSMSGAGFRLTNFPLQFILRNEGIDFNANLREQFYGTSEDYPKGTDNYPG